MLRPSLVIAAVVLALAGPSMGSAREKLVADPAHCVCWCLTSHTAGGARYDSHGQDCSAFEGQSCTVEDPQTRLVETGRLRACINPTVTGEGPPDELPFVTSGPNDPGTQGTPTPGPNGIAPQ